MTRRGISLRLSLRLWLPGLVAAISLSAATPALASPPQSITVTPCSSCTPSSSTFTAGGDSSYTTTIVLDTGNGTPQTLSTQLASGLLANLSSNTALSCLTTTTDNASCVIGGGTISTALASPDNSLPFTAYMVAPSAGNIVGVDFVVTIPSPVTTVHLTGEISVQQLSSGPVVATQTTDLSNLGPVQADVTGLTFNVNGTLPDGSPLTRMPSACTPASPTSLTVTYLLGPETTVASPDVNVSSTCDTLPYNPHVTGSATRDVGDTGTQVVTEVTQTAAEAATASTTLLLPPNVVQPNAGALALSNSTTPVGSVTATTPLLPSSIPLTGSVFLSVSSSLSASLQIIFTSPLPITIHGAQNPDGSLTFAGTPDLPLTDLKVTLFGGAEALFMSSCAVQSGTLNAGFTGQNGAAVSASSTFALSGCPSGSIPSPVTTIPAGTTTGLPTLSGISLSGLRKRHPTLRFKVTHGANAPDIAALSVHMPSGLSFNRKAFHKIRACKGKGKKRRCTTTLKVKGLSLSGARLKGAKLSGGNLVVTLKKAVTSVSATITSPLVAESKGLQKRVNKGQVKSLRVTVSVTDAQGTTTTIVAVVKA